MNEELGRLEQKIDDLGRDLRVEMRVLNEQTRTELRALEHDLRVEMRTLNDETQRAMRVLHEEVLDRIAALAPDFGPIRREFQRADDDLRESIDQRQTPLEASERARRKS